MKSDSGKIVFPDPGQQLQRTRAFADFDDEDPDAVEKSVPAPKFTFLGSKVLFFLSTPLFFSPTTPNASKRQGTWLTLGPS